MSGQSATDKGVTVWCIDDTKPDGFAPCIVGFVNGAYVSYDSISLQEQVQVQVFIDTLAAQRPNNLIKQEEV